MQVHQLQLQQPLPLCFKKFLDLCLGSSIRLTFYFLSGFVFYILRSVQVSQTVLIQTIQLSISIQFISI